MEDLSRLSDEELIRKMKTAKIWLIIGVSSFLITLILLFLFGKNNLYLIFLILPFNPVMLRFKKYQNEIHRRNLML